MNKITIPQKKNANLMYGLGVFSPFFKYEEELKSKKQAFNINSRARDFLESHNLVEDNLFEASILNNTYLKDMVISKDTEIVLDDISIFLDVENSANIKITIPNTRTLGEITNSVIILHISPNCKVNLEIFHDASEGESKQTMLIKAVVEDYGELNLNELLIANSIMYRMTHITLNGNHALAYPSHAVYAYDNAKLDIKSKVVHYGKKTESNMKLRTIINDNAEVIVQGKIKINKNASNSNGYQKEDILLIGENAIACPIPKLEIANHEVACSHGATISNFNKEEIFYLMSRGISRENAKKLIIFSFLKPITDNLRINYDVKLQSRIRGD